MDDRHHAVHSDGGLTVRKLALSIATLVALAVLGAVIVRPHTPSAGSLAAVSGSSPGSEDAPSDQNGDSVAAARQAAIDAVAATPSVVQAGFISRRDVISSFATARYAPKLADETSAQLDELLVEVGRQDVDVDAMQLTERPISATATPTPAGVQVAVWSVLVISLPGSGPARQIWRTVRLQMQDDGGRWLVDDWKSTLGPTPSPAADATYEDASVFNGPLGWDRADVAEVVR